MLFCFFFLHVALLDIRTTYGFETIDRLVENNVNY